MLRFVHFPKMTHSSCLFMAEIQLFCQPLKNNSTFDFKFTCMNVSKSWQLWAFTPIICLLLSFQAMAQTGGYTQKVSAELKFALERGEKCDFIAILKGKADISLVSKLSTKEAKARFVDQKLRETAHNAQQELIAYLKNRPVFANSLYLVNAVAVEQADWAMVNDIAQMASVERIVADPWVYFGGTVQGDQLAVSNRNGTTWGVEKIHAPAVWDMGFKGQGIVVGGADTGYDWMHPALIGQYGGWDGVNADHNYHWHDAIHEINPLNNDSFPTPASNPCGLDASAPCDDNSHGTHTMGTMAGFDGVDQRIGVAPEAKWIGCRNMERGWGKPSSYIECFQWFLAPTDINGQNPDPNKAPDVINNSWYCSAEEGCTDLAVEGLIHQALINLRASGVVVIVSIGNSGPNCSSAKGAPGYFEESLSVGATEQSDTVAKFSSRGPVDRDSSFRLKPNVVAPGAGVWSSIPGGGYAPFWGTSMAGPHAAGMTALILSANPALRGQVDVVENILEETAVPLYDTLDCLIPGNISPNNAYGYGRIDALAAVNAALALVPVQNIGEPSAHVFPNPSSGSVYFDFENCPGPVDIEVFDVQGKRVYAGNSSIHFREIVPVELKNCSSGVYFYRVKTETTSFKGKIELLRR